MGVSIAVPSWVAILEAAEGDPLRAMEIEEEISQEWWERYALWNKLKAEGQKAHLDKHKGSKRG